MGQERLTVHNMWTGEDDEITRVEVGHFGKELPIKIQLNCDDGPYASLTIDLGSYAGNGSVCMPYAGWLDTNNYPWAPRFLSENGIAEPYMRFGEPVEMRSGFCTYPLYQFNAKRLRELDPKGTEDYYASWVKNVEKVRKKMAFA